MPIRIQQYQPGQVRTKVTRHPDMRTPDMGTREIKGILSTAAQGLQMLGRERDAAAKEHAKTSLLKYNKGVQDILSNPETGYMQLDGKTAFDSRQGAINAVKKLRQELASELKDPRSVKMFEQAVAPSQLRTIGDIQQHASRGFKSWQSETRNLIIKGAIDNAAGLFNQTAVPTPGAPGGTENRLAIEYLKGKAELVDGLDQDGITGEARESAIQDYTQKFYGRALTGAAAVGPEAGKQALEDFGDKVDPRTRAMYEAKLKALAERKAKHEADVREAAARSAHLDYLTTLAESMSGASFTEINDKLRNMPREDQGMFLSKWRLFHNLQQKADSEAQVNAYNTALSAIGGNPLKSPEYFKNNPDVMAAMGPELAQKLADGTRIKTNKAFKTALSVMPFDKLRNVDPVKARLNLDNQDYQEYLNDLQKPREEYEVQRNQLETVQAQVMSAAEQLNGGTPYQDWDEEQRQRALQMKASVESKLRLWHRQHSPQEKVPNEVLQAAIADALRPILQTQVGGAAASQAEAQNLEWYNVIPVTQFFDMGKAFFTGETEAETGNFFDTRTPEEIDFLQGASEKLGVAANVKNMLFLQKHMDDLRALGTDGFNQLAAISYRARAMGHPLSAEEVFNAYERLHVPDPNRDRSIPLPTVTP